MTAVGQPLSRAEGRLKVTGSARYTADLPVPGIAHAAIVHSTVAKGRTESIDTRDAEHAPGVLAVFTGHNLPRMNPTPKRWSHLHPHGQGYLPLQDDKIHYAGQPVALVVAETLDAAAYAGILIKVEYAVEPPALFSRESAKEAVDPPQFLWPVFSSVGDAENGVAAGAFRIDETYTTTDRHHNQMEPHTTTAVWDEDGTLSLYETTQHIFGVRELMSIVLGIPVEKINIVCEFLGGGFGGKAYVWPHTLLAALAAKVLGRPVKLQLTRAQMYSMAGHQCHQPATIQRIVLGVDRNGRLTGIRHDSISPTPVFEYAATASRSLWAASGGIATSHKVVHVNRNTPTAMRAPHEALGHFALESAMDELSYRAAIDPVALRLRNDTNTDPLSGRPFSTRAMRKCLLDGAARFGWETRSPEPCSMRDGRYLIGQGMAGGDLHALALAGEGARDTQPRRYGAGRNWLARPRHRNLHRAATRRGRCPGSATRNGNGAARRHEATRIARVDRLGDDGQCRCLGAAGCQRRLATRRWHWRIEIRTSAMPSCWRGAGCRRFPPRPTTIRSPNRMDQRPSSVSRRSSPRCASTPNWVWCASIASSGLTTPAASSIRRRRAVRR
jgi:xanthine dehydrogenase YagR molybdenum-binding subunit